MKFMNETLVNRGRNYTKSIDIIQTKWKEDLVLVFYDVSFKTLKSKVG